MPSKLPVFLIRRRYSLSILSSPVISSQVINAFIFHLKLIDNLIVLIIYYLAIFPHLIT